MPRRRRWHFFMSPLEHSALRKLDDRYRGLFTPAGRALVWATAGSAMLLLGGVHLPLVAAFSFCAACLVAAAIVGAPFRPRLRLTRNLGSPPSAGDELSYSVTVENLGKTTARGLVIEERDLPFELRPRGEPEVIDALPPGATAEVKLRLACGSRGAYDLAGLQAASLFPSALVKWPRRASGGQRLLVYPRFTPLETFDVPQGRNHQPGGIPVASHIGDSTEFLGTREFREGDRPRDIHWPSFARTGKLIVKEFQEEFFARLALVLDVESRTAKDELLLEKALSLAAGIAGALARREYIIDLFAAGAEIHQFRAGRALAHFDNILEILACIEGGGRLDVGALEAALLPEARRLSAVVLVMMDWDEKRADLVRKLKEHGIAVRVVSVRPGKRPVGLAASEVVELS